MADTGLERKMIYVNSDHPDNARRVLLASETHEWVHGFVMPHRDLAMQHVHAMEMIRGVEDASYIKFKRRMKKDWSGK